MRRDPRERRVRNTLTVDLGTFGLPLLDGCMDGVRNLLASRHQFYKARKLKRGEVVRLALHVLKLTIEGKGEPLPEALAAVFRFIL